MTDQQQESPDDVADVSDAPRSTTLKRSLLGAGVGVGLLAIGYSCAAFAVRDKVPEGTTVAGVNVGGMTQQDAQRAVAQKAQFPQRNQDVKITVGENTITFKPGSSWTVDAAASTRGLTGFSFNPSDVSKRIFGGDERRAGTFHPDVKALEDQVAKEAATDLPDAAKDGTVKFIAGQVHYTPGTAGYTVHEDQVARDIAAHFPQQTQYTAKAKMAETSSNEKALASFAENGAKHAMSQPLKVTANGNSVSVPATIVSDAISTKVVEGKPTIAVKSKVITNYVFANATGMQVAPVDAKVIWKQGKPSVAGSKDGKVPDTKDAEKLISAALLGNHHVTFGMKPEKAQVTKDDIDVNALPKPQMSHFESALPGGPENAARTKNITVAINRLNGQVIKPGQQFSLLRALGYDLDKKNGYVEAGTIQNGIHMDGMGGGVSQVSTVVYNTAFFAGVQLDAHTSHAFYLSRYPEGREATLWNPGIDNTWTNDTGHPILIKSSVKNGVVHMTFYGTKQYTVQTHKGPRTHVLQPKVKTLYDRKGCENTKGNGTEGFAVDNYRQLLKDGKVVHSQKIHVVYQPDDIIRCVNTGKPDTPAGSDSQGGNKLKDTENARTVVTRQQ